MDDLKDEVQAMPLTDAQVEAVQSIVNRDYDRFEWYGLDIVPGDDLVADRFSWGADQPTVPYFEASYRGVDYDSTTMGLGELSVHLLFWILQQYELTEELVILVDEPDAYLPPIAASALLARMLSVILEKRTKWRMVVSTHSADIIAAAVGHDSFLFLEIDPGGAVQATSSKDDVHISELLLARPEVRHVVFVEDESAYHLARALIEGMDRRVGGSLSLVWGNGFGYMRALQDPLRKARHQDIGFVMVFDGDQRPAPAVPIKEADAAESVVGAVAPTGSRVPPVSEWQAVYLPTSSDPDKLYKSLLSDREVLAARLGRPLTELNRVISALEGKDAHDWVNGIASGMDRTKTLAAFAELWVELHPVASASFRNELATVLMPLRRR
ncbi:hypothetical protein IFU40_02255 [Microbacterium sp. CFBP 13617]|uniref:hypothetical protein n=1 Tax=Microbacterium sp. CFBP 13617 TaxID=2774035 RepID=UPI0017871079|nr:hypothetical protein [Microbacterium sp. CFBP 13617]MBD8217451.1 hypothetical protein [Microbacterium sp. CFBP 13617]